MAFCTFCGKKLEDGEVCTCQQQAAPQPAQSMPQGTPVQSMPQGAPAYEQTAPQPKKPNVFGEGFKSIGEFFKGIFRKPFDATEEFFDKANIIASGFMWLVLMVVYVVESILNTAMAYVMIENGSEHRIAYMYQNCPNFVRAMFVGTFNDEAIFDIGFGSFVQAFFFPIFWMVTMTAVVFGLGFLINILFVKGNFKKSVSKIAALCGVTATGLVIVQVIAIFKNFIVVSGVNVFLTIIQSAVSLFVLIQGLVCIKKVIPDKNKAFLAMIISIAGLVLSSYLLELFFGYFEPYFITLVF